ncbi:glycosyl transferase family 64 domain-containing protein [Stachybotrys elegans]|uniref:Glycosyl transferase family 64 domain-containing protein n=1 Tax=Stachybotrys elegans TaxID=80388 RepID=A0A8K0WQB7_9HYPO|nr:glycosyl transferase family 64 domain-containing protein [Stachybotrys elegans]
MEPYYSSMQNAFKNRSYRRMGILIGAIAALIICAGAFLHYGPETRIPSWSDFGMPASDDDQNLVVDTPTVHKTDGRVDLCSTEHAPAAREFEKTIAKYSHLKEDKFTIAMQTYKRPDELKRTLDALLSEDIPSLEEVFIVWNDLDENPPSNYKSEFGVPVTYRMSERNSLNMRLQPKPDYKTQAILLTDDDVYYHPSDLEFVFQTWRKFGHNRLVGALARCSTVDDKSKQWKYGFCSKNDDNYAMVLTNLAFSHIAFMDYYSSSDPRMTRIRDYVDKGLNCEDIAMNFVTSYLTREGPLLVTGHEKYVNYEPKQGISRKPGHLEARSKCLNDFAEMFSCMPLVNETAYVDRGVRPM